MARRYSKIPLAVCERSRSEAAFVFRSFTSRSQAFKAKK